MSLLVFVKMYHRQEFTVGALFVGCKFCYLTGVIKLAAFTQVSSALSEKVVLQSKLSNGSRAAAAAPSLPSTERDEELTKLRGQVKILELELETRCTGQSANTGKSVRSIVM